MFEKYVAENPNAIHNFSATLRGGSGQIIASQDGEVKAGDVFNMDSPLPYVLVISPAQDLDLVFDYSTSRWDLRSSQCRYGDLAHLSGTSDSPDEVLWRETTCAFECSVAKGLKRYVNGESQRKVVLDQRDHLRSKTTGQNGVILHTRRDSDPESDPESEPESDPESEPESPIDSAANWKKCAERGLKLWKEWESINDGKSLSCTDFDDKFVLKGLTKGRMSTAKASNFPTSFRKKQFYKVTAIYKADAKVKFENLISAEEGVFIAENNNRISSDGTTVSWYFSDVAWILWKKAVLADNPTATDFSQLKTFWRFSIENAETKDVLATAYQKVGVKNQKTEQTFAPEKDVNEADLD